MKKKLLSIISVLLMIAMMFTLTACGDDESSKKEEKETPSSPEAAVKEFLGYVEDGKFNKASKLVDWTISYKINDEYYYSYSSVDYEEIEDMSSKELKKYKNSHESSIDSAEDYFKSYEKYVKDVYSFKISKDIEKAEKVKGTKSIYKVEADVEMEWKENKKDDEENTQDTITFYVMKDDGEYKIIKGVYDIRSMLYKVAY